MRRRNSIMSVMKRLAYAKLVKLSFSATAAFINIEDFDRRRSEWPLSARRVKERTSMIQSKTGKPVQFEITETTRVSLERWIGDPEMNGHEFLWPSRFHGSPHLSTRQYARIVRGWVMSLGLEPSAYGTHSMRRTKVAQFTRRPATSARSSCFWGIQRWTARCATSASISRTPCHSRRGSTYEANAAGASWPRL